jgi:hypothetical protein
MTGYLHVLSMASPLHGNGCGVLVVLLLEQIRALNKDVWLSPLAIKDEHNRCPRVLVDHTYFGINQHMVKDLPPEVMQFSGTLPRIMWILQHADLDEGPIYMAKFDLVDGFY